MLLPPLTLSPASVTPPYGINIIEPVLEQHFRLICQVLARYGFRYRRESTPSSVSDRRFRARIWHSARGYEQFGVELCCNFFVYRDNGAEMLRLHVGAQLILHDDAQDSLEPLLPTVSVECGPLTCLAARTSNLHRFLERHFDASVLAGIVNERMSK